MAQNYSPTPIHRASTFTYVERLMEWRVLQCFRTLDSVRQRKLLQLRITNDNEVCPGKANHSNTSDWLILHLRPERDHLAGFQVAR